MIIDMKHEATWYPPYSYGTIKNELHGKQKEDKIERLIPKFKSNFKTKENISMSNEFNPISVSTVDGRVSIGLSREEALELYVSLSDGCQRSHVGYTLEGLLRDYFVKNTAVMSEDTRLPF